MTNTPRTNAAILASNGQWSYVLKLCDEELERELTAVIKERDRLQTIVDEQCRVSSVCREYREQRDRLAEALQKLADCDWVITLPDRMDAVRSIAREALSAVKGGSNES